MPHTIALVSLLKSVVAFTVGTAYDYHIYSIYVHEIFKTLQRGMNFAVEHLPMNSPNYLFIAIYFII